MYNLIDLLMVILVVGIGATLVMDIWALFLQRVLGIPSLSYCLVGRWISHMQHGIFSHPKIADAEVQPGECWLGWTTHYLIGIAYAALLLLFTQGAWVNWFESNPLNAFFAALAVGTATVVFPFFVMQPALGFGIAASKNPKPGLARCKTLLTHCIFGMGLYFAGWLYHTLW
jgi:hypothetical protein